MKEYEKVANAKKFVKRWSGKGYEKGESQKFWIDLLQNVYGVEMPTEYMEFEVPIMLDHTSFIDVYIPATKVIIEQKSIGKPLDKAIKQSDGSMLTPMQQMKRYADNMNYSVKPRWGISCNFQEFMIFDFDNIHGEPELIKLADLPTNLHRLDFLIEKDNTHIKQEIAISIEAGKIVGKVYDAIKANYKEINEDTLKDLNILCVRLIFCLYAEDAGIFEKNQFYKYMKSFKPEYFRKELIELFHILNTPINERDEYLETELAEFPYVNGGLFAGEIKIPKFDVGTVNTILEEASFGFNWKPISPTIFGAVFESTLSTKLRRAGGMHYTSIENIHKVIDPLFLDDLKKEYDDIVAIAQAKSRKNLLLKFQEKLASLTFLDPACGSGNFLTETYISLRRLENKVIEALHGLTIALGFSEGSPIKVSIQQFYGIEINDFAVSVAKTALWIAEFQMMEETAQLVTISEDFLPLKTYNNIVEGNALRIDWNDVVPKEKLDYIMGNPPFLGARLMIKEQKSDILSVYIDEKGKQYKTAGNIDYVAGWYFKASELMQNTNIKTAFVSTNSITQGEQVAGVWKPLYDRFNIHIDFAWTTFKWASESSEQAAVHVVIVGFSTNNTNNNMYIITNGRKVSVKNINPYLCSAENIFIENKNKPISEGVPEARSGNKPIDGGFYLFTKEEMNYFIKIEPKAKKLFRPWIGSHEFINRYCRYCLWLGETPISELIKMSKVMERVEAVRKFRLESKSEGTVKIADRPTHFHVETIPTNTYLVLPLTSSENRKYVPIGFMDKEYLPSNLVLVVSNASIYHFGVLTSNVFMEWMRTVCGRLEMRYRITKNNVYNNFPWCTPTEVQRQKIERTAKAIIDARNIYQDCNYAEMYGDKMYLFPELLNAHQENDKAVMEAYGFYKDGKWFSPTETVSALMKMYQELVEK